MIYKIAKNGKVQTWDIEVSDNKYRTISGYEDGQKVTSEWTVCSGKNIGRSNETTPVQQAQLEADALLTKKLEQGGYSKTKTKAKAGHQNIDCMLAKKFEDYPPTEEQYKNKEVYCQPKLDGVRCIATKDGLFSRENKKIVSAPHIEAELAFLFKKDPDLILDGELYADKLSDDFQAIISLVRKVKNIDTEKAKAIEYHIYDTLCIGGKSDLPFSKRTLELSRIIPTNNSLRLVATYCAKSQDELDQYYTDFMSKGYEGQMVRLDKPYEPDRSKTLLKRKEFQDKEFVILDILEGKGNRSGMAGKILYQITDTITCESGIRGDEKFFTDILKNKKKYIGGIGTVRYFGFTEDGKLRFPVTVAIYSGKRDL